MTVDRSILSVRGLHAGYGRTPILHGIDFRVGQGEIVAIVGRNGVGKSTLMKSRIGLLPSTQGEITFGGVDVTRAPANARAVRGTGYIPQGRHVFPRLTVRKNLMRGMAIGGPRREKQLELVLRTFLILHDRRDQKAGTMSDGEQQQLAIGRALIGNPDLMLLDEPSEGIQPSIVSQIARDMRKLNRELGLSVLFVEQNIDMILSMAHRCYVMDKGRIVAEVAPGRRFCRPQVPGRLKTQQGD